ncbi:MAG: hypothetical protein MUC78_12945 [Bacteroidales bacterium]|nr:hypothetical protein [Bacteroidales bacterium]
MKYHIHDFDVSVKPVTATRRVRKPLYAGDSWEVSQGAFFLRMSGVGEFYVCRGSEIEFKAEAGADPEWVKLCLNGQVLAALLHQRKIINFHASSFALEGQGIMAAGATGAGKSSLTVAFALGGAGFLTDDFTPVIFREGKPLIRPVRREVKLRKDTAEALAVDETRLRDAEAGTGKWYMKIDQADADDYPLQAIIKIEVGDVNEPVFPETSSVERFEMLRSEICSWEMLAGMPETEAEYLQQLVKIVEQVKFVKVVRPKEIRIASFHDAVRDHLAWIR